MTKAARFQIDRDNPGYIIKEPEFERNGQRRFCSYCNTQPEHIGYSPSVPGKYICWNCWRFNNLQYMQDAQMHYNDNLKSKLGTIR